MMVLASLGLRRLAARLLSTAKPSAVGELPSVMSAYLGKFSNDFPNLDSAVAEFVRGRGDVAHLARSQKPPSTPDEVRSMREHTLRTWALYERLLREEVYLAAESVPAPPGDDSTATAATTRSPHRGVHLGTGLREVFFPNFSEHNVGIFTSPQAVHEYFRTTAVPIKGGIGSELIPQACKFAITPLDEPNAPVPRTVHIIAPGSVGFQLHPIEAGTMAAANNPVPHKPVLAALSFDVGGSGGMSVIVAKPASPPVALFAELRALLDDDNASAEAPSAEASSSLEPLRAVARVSMVQVHFTETSGPGEVRAWIFVLDADNDTSSADLVAAASCLQSTADRGDFNSHLSGIHADKGIGFYARDEFTFVNPAAETVIFER
jgi:hypothetical protein